MDIYDQHGRLIATSSPDSMMGHHAGTATRKILSISPLAAWGTITLLWTYFATLALYHNKSTIFDYVGIVNLLCFLSTCVFSKTRALGVIISAIMLLGVGAVALVPSHPFIIAIIAWAAMAIFDKIAQGEKEQIEAKEIAEAQAKVDAQIAAERYQAELELAHLEAIRNEALKPKIDHAIAYQTSEVENGVALHMRLTLTNRYQQSITMAKGTLLLKDPLDDVISEEEFTMAKPLTPGESYNIDGSLFFANNSTQASILRHGQEINYLLGFEKILLEDGTLIS
jgi:hypothetical protein